MCMEDVRIARATVTTTKQIPITSELVMLVVPHNPDRYSLMIQVFSSDGWVLQCGSNGPPTFTGLASPLQREYLLIDLQHHGDMVRQPWYLYAIGSSIEAFVVETILREQ